MRILRLVVAFLAISIPLMAQAAHSSSLSWNHGVTGATFNLYRAPCTGTITAGACSTEGTFAKINTAAITTKTYVDTAVTAGASYSWYVTAVCVQPACGNDPSGAPYNGESAPSNHFAAKIPSDPIPPPAPSNLTVTSVAQVINGANRTLTAKWTDDANVSTSWQFWIPGGRVLASGVLVNATGSYTQSTGVKVRPGTQIGFTVCDTTGNCKSQQVL